jgi:hypothetical protein
MYIMVTYQSRKHTVVVGGVQAAIGRAVVKDFDFPSVVIVVECACLQDCWQRM